MRPAVDLCDIPKYEEIHVEELDQGRGLVDLDADPAAEGGEQASVEVIWGAAWGSRLSGRITWIPMPWDSGCIRQQQVRLACGFYIVSPACSQLSWTYLELGPAEGCFLCMDSNRSARSSPAGIRLGLEGPAGPGYDVTSMASLIVGV